MLWELFLPTPPTLANNFVRILSTLNVLYHEGVRVLQNQLDTYPALPLRKLILQIKAIVGIWAGRGPCHVRQYVNRLLYPSLFSLSLTLFSTTTACNDFVVFRRDASSRTQGGDYEELRGLAVPPPLPSKQNSFIPPGELSNFSR